LRIVLKSLWEGEVLHPFRGVAAPQLQFLEVVNDSYDPYFTTVKLFSSGAPRLSFLKMDGVKLQLPAAGWTASLTHLELRYQASSNEVVATISQCPLLVHLHLDMSGISTNAIRFHIPTLKSLHISISDSQNDLHLLGILNLFDTPALTECVADGTHGDQISLLLNSTSLPHASFPALTSFSFTQQGSCTCEADLPFSRVSPPFALFPALSSLTLINQCFTHNLVEDMLGPASQPRPLLQTLTLCPMEDAVDGVCAVLKDAVHSKRGQPLPKFRLSRALASREDWQGSGVDTEIFDPADVLRSFE